MTEGESNSFRLPKRRCIGGHRHGTRVDLSTFWYYCNDGHLKNAGCFAGNRKRLTIDEVYESLNHQIQCIVDKSGFLRLRYTACIMDDQLHYPQDTWNDANNQTWYRCENSGPTTLQIQVEGCVINEAGDRMRISDEFVDKDVIYRCSTSDQKKMDTWIEAVGCMHYAKRFGLNEHIEVWHKRIAVPFEVHTENCKSSLFFF